MYRYYQVGEKSPWTPISDDAQVFENARKANAKKITILAVSEVVDDETTDKASLSYRGPLYFDIDCKDNLQQAIESTRLLVHRLRDLQVPDHAIEVVASGSKGLHVMVPQSVFSSGRPFQQLPLVYLEMAKELHVLGLDFQVYSMGRGVCWRLLNVKREHDGKYPVPLTLPELAELTPERYREYVQEPRPKPQYDLKGVKAAGLASLFERARKAVKDKPAPASSVVPTPKLQELQENPPPCLYELGDYNTREEKNFNEVALQFGALIARSGISASVWEPQASRMAESGHSSQYDSPKSRYEHVLGMVSYAQAKPSLYFACNAMRGVLRAKVCETCPIFESGDDEQDHGLELGIMEKDDGYFLPGPKSDHRISTFVLNPVDVYMEQPQRGGAPIRVATDFEVIARGNVLGLAHFQETSWSSRSRFLQELEGIANLSFIGTDADIQRIKHIVYKEGRELGEITRVHAAGIHLQEIGRRDVRVYVEPGMSVNELRVSNTHQLVDNVLAPPKLKDRKLPMHADPDVTHALQNLLRINSKGVVAQLLGWFSACHLKVHFMKRYTQFPLLSVWGPAGAGKTKATSLFAWLNGCDYTLLDAPVNLASTTQWSIVSYCASTTTVPRLLDEYNKSKMSKKMYDFCGEVMKASWGGQVMTRGQVRRSAGTSRTNAEVVQIPVSAPLVIMSEQAPTMPALQQRSVQVMLTRHGRLGCEDAFFEASAAREQLARMAKAMVTQALRTPLEWIEDRLNAYQQVVPKEMEDRPQYSYQLLLVGLDFFGHCCRELGLAVDEDVRGLKRALIDMLSEDGQEIARNKARSEVDVMLEDIGTMISLSADGHENWLREGRHYAVADQWLLLDIPIVHALYKRYKIQSREGAVIDSSGQFATLLKQEQYYEGQVVSQVMGVSRPVAKLNLEKMEEKGILTSIFTP